MRVPSHPLGYSYAYARTRTCPSARLLWWMAYQRKKSQP